MIAIIVVIHVIVSLLLIGLVLIQSGKGTGLGAVFGIGGEVGQSLLGVGAGTFLTRITTVLAMLFMVTSLSLAVLMGHSEKSLVEGMGKKQTGVATQPAGKSEKAVEKGQGEKASGDEGIPRSPEKNR